MMSITINQIKYVLAIHKTGSFSEAADTCFVTQSTLSTMVKKLENALDIELFDRKKKPIALTPAGEKLIAQFKVVFNETENLTELVQETKKEFTGSLNIGVIPTLAPFLLPLFLDSLVKEFPEIDFSVFEITTDKIIERIKLREIDVGILSLPILEKEIQNIPLFHEEFMVFDSRKKISKAKRYRVEDIDIDRLWLLEESHCLTNQIEKICLLKKKRKVKNNLILKSSSLLTILNLIQKSNGVTLIPKLAAEQNIDLKKNIFPLQSPVPVREVGLIIHENYNKKRILDILKNTIQKSVAPVLGKSKKVKVINPF